MSQFSLFVFESVETKKIKVNYLDIDAKNVTMYLENFEARVFQHEFDHLDGITFDTRVSKLKLQMAKDKQKKLEKRYG